MRSRSNGGVIGAYALPNQNYANGVFFIHDAAIFNTGPNPIWPLASGVIVSATGGTISTAADNSNYRTHTFTSNTTFTVVNGSGLMEILLVGGGGTGGSARTGGSYYQAGGGGAGGGVTLVTTWVNPGTTFTVTVGPGGTNPLNDVTATYNGGNTSVISTAGHNYAATGGGGGASAYYNFANTPKSGGPGGGARAQGTSSPSAGNGASPGGSYTYAYAGGSAYAVNGSAYAGGGGGAGEPGYSGSYSANTAMSSYGGNGWLWSRTNSYYGAGGGGGRSHTSPGNQRAFGGLHGPAPGSRALNYGGFSSSSTGGEVGSSGGTSYFYGIGGGGSVSNNEDTNRWGANGSPGTVIFCYRYR